MTIKAFEGPQANDAAALSIATSSWFQRLDPAQYARIGISRGTPRGQSGFKRYRALEPGAWFNSIDLGEYRTRYFAEVLAKLDPQRVVDDLMAMAAQAGAETAVLLCYEPPTHSSAPCHRGLVSAWLADELGLDVPEIGQIGSGWNHPKVGAFGKTAAPDQPPLL